MSERETAANSRRGARLVQFPGLGALPPLARFSLRGPLSSLASALGSARVPISQQPCRAIEGEDCASLWLGPDEQLLLASDSGDSQLAQILRTNLVSVPHSLVDISHRQTGFEITGPAARTILNAGCPLDLSEAGFPVGMCTRTLFEKSEMVLWRRSADTFHVEVWRSFAPYLTGLLERAAHEL